MNKNWTEWEFNKDNPKTNKVFISKKLKITLVSFSFL